MTIITRDACGNILSAELKRKQSIAVLPFSLINPSITTISHDETSNNQTVKQPTTNWLTDRQTDRLTNWQRILRVDIDISRWPQRWVVLDDVANNYHLIALITIKWLQTLLSWKCQQHFIISRTLFIVKCFFKGLQNKFAWNKFLCRAHDDGGFLKYNDFKWTSLNSLSQVLYNWCRLSLIIIINIELFTHSIQSIASLKSIDFSLYEKKGGSVTFSIQ